MNICEYNEKCPCVDNCDRKIEITTYKDVEKGIRRFTQGFEECDMSKAETYPCKECVADKFKNFKWEDFITLVEFAERTSSMLLSEWQKQFLMFYEQAKKEHRPIVLVTPRINGRRILMQIIDAYEKEIEQNGY